MTKMRKYLVWFVSGDYQFLVYQEAYIFTVDYSRYIHKIWIYSMINSFLFWFQNFREHVCKYKGNVIFSLVDTEDIGSCQDSCTSYMPECEFFNYDSDRKICELLDSGERECDMVRGTPTPDFEKCKLDGHIHWP